MPEQARPHNGGDIALSPRARQLARSLADNPLDLDGADASPDPELQVAVSELLDARLATMQTRDGRLMLKRTALPL
jgi:hypothetical protein